MACKYGKEEDVFDNNSTLADKEDCISKQEKFTLNNSTIEFTSIEKLSIVNVLINMMNIDNNVDPREVLYFNQIQNNIHISNAEFEKGKEQQLLISLLCIKGMPNSKKLVVGIMLQQMIQADGVVNPRELELFNFLAESTGLDALITSLKHH